MSVVPNKKLQRVQFYESHLSPWTTNAVAIGTTAPAVTDLQTKTQAARAAFDAQQAAKQTAKAKTEAFLAAVKVMGTAGAAIMKQIRAKGESTGDPNVYELAEIPGPATPTPQGPPGTPFDFKVKLFQNGSLELKWKCSNPPGGGVVYNVYRRNEATGQFHFLGGTTMREFGDSTIPAGSSQITYQIQGVRASGIGAVAEFNVNFGTNAAGAMTASVSTAEMAPKLAA
jgi:hypothetical protein